MQITPAYGLGWSPDRRGGAVGSEDLHPDLPFGRCIIVLLLIPSKATLSKGYENVARGRRHIGRTAHGGSEGEDLKEKEGVQQKTHPARRWVVERTISWLTKRRSLRTRWSKKSANWLAMIQFACAHVLLNVAVFG
jgi:hypothetical protein